MKSRHRYRVMILGLVLCDILDHTLHCHIDFNHQKGSKTLASGEFGAELDHSCPRAVVIRVKQYGHLAQGIMFAVQLWYSLRNLFSSLWGTQGAESAFQAVASEQLSGGTQAAEVPNKLPPQNSFQGAHDKVNYIYYVLQYIGFKGVWILVLFPCGCVLLWFLYSPAPNHITLTRTRACVLWHEVNTL